MEKSVTKVGGNTKKTEKRRKKKDFYFRRLFRDIKKNPTLYVMSLPAFILIVVFSYIPMAGILMAFQEYSLADGLFGSEWIGFTNFKLFFSSYYCKNVILNTFFHQSLFTVRGIRNAHRVRAHRQYAREELGWKSNESSFDYSVLYLDRHHGFHHRDVF